VGGGPEEAASALAEKPFRAVSDPRLCVLFASPTQRLEQLAPAVKARVPGGTVLGASTAGAFVASGDTQGHCVAFALDGDFEVRGGLGRGLADDPQAAVAAALESVEPAIEGYPHRTGLLLLDTLSGNGEEAALIASALLGGVVRLSGGAAGDDDMSSNVVSFYGVV